MDTVESLGYLKGLLDGLELDENKKETKIIKAIIDVLSNLNDDIDGLYEDLEELADATDAIDEDLADLEEFVYDDDDDEFFDDDDEFEIECPNCGEIISVDEETVMEGGIDCPNCGEKLEFEVEFDEEEDE